VRSIACPAQPGVTAPVQMIWLPGAYHSAQDFLDAGFAQAVLVRNIPLDLIFVDLVLLHLADRSALERLQSEVVRPARARGISVWLGGVSLGGMMALEIAAAYAGEIDRLCLLAPYLGNRMLTAEIAAAPGIRNWEPGELAQADDERRIWRYIKAHGADSRPILYLGFGQDDRFAAAQTLLADALPADSVNVVKGGHDWRTWTMLWENFLDSRFT
jgi:pimeloyl-ACP methyl ester carboxylesterase